MELPWVELQNWLSKPFASWVQPALAATGSVELSQARAVGERSELLFPPCCVPPLGFRGLSPPWERSPFCPNLSSPVLRARMWGQNLSAFSGRRPGTAVLARDALAPCWAPRTQGERDRHGPALTELPTWRARAGKGEANPTEPGPREVTRLVHGHCGGAES